MHLGRSRSRDNASAGLDPETVLGVDSKRGDRQDWIQGQHFDRRKSRCSTWAGITSETALSQKWIPETADSTEAGVDPETALIGWLGHDQRQHKGGRQ